MDIAQTKQATRERMWALLERERAVPPGVHGRIPAFVGAEAAADRLAALPVWRSARVIKAVPDKAQLPVRARALTKASWSTWPFPGWPMPCPSTCSTQRR